MQKKSLTLLLPSLLSGCTAFNATPVPDTTPPALVFVDDKFAKALPLSPIRKNVCFRHR